MKTLLAAALALALPLAPLRSAPQGLDRIALVGGWVHTQVEGEAPRLATILIEDDLIAKIGPPELELPPGTVRYDVSGKHIVPGLIDGLVNFDPDHDALYLSAGVTTVRDIGGDRVKLLLERQPDQRDATPGPWLLTSGVTIDGDPPTSSEALILRNADAAEGYLPLLLEEGYDFLSIQPGLPLDAWRKLLDIALGNDLPVWGPVPRGATLAQAIEAGQSGFHFLDTLLPAGVQWEFVQAPAFRSGIQALATARRPLVPVLESSAVRLKLQDQDARAEALLALLMPTYDSWWRQELTVRRAAMDVKLLETGRRVVDKQFALVRELHKAGVPLLAGSGAPQPWLLPGWALHEEMARWVEAGLAPGEVLHAVTAGAAQILGIENERGVLRPLTSADLIVSVTDPREDLSGLATPELVCVRGRMLERRDLDDLLNTVAARAAAARAELAKPVALDPPVFTDPAAAVILEGIVETKALGQRVSTERFQVARLPDGLLAFAARVLYDTPGQTLQREMTLEQVVDNARLVRASVEIRQGESHITFDGLWTANSWRMQSRINGQPLGNSRPVRERPLCAEVSSVTSLLILAQHELGERLPVLNFREALETELVFWRSELDHSGNHQVRTHLGQKAFKLNAAGAPERVVARAGTGFLETVLLSYDTFGGPGLGLPSEKRAAIREAIARGPVEPAEAGSAPAGTDGEDAPLPITDEAAEDDAPPGEDGER